MLFLDHIYRHLEALRVSEEHSNGVEWVYTWSPFHLVCSLIFTLSSYMVICFLHEKKYEIETSYGGRIDFGLQCEGHRPSWWKDMQLVEICGSGNCYDSLSHHSRTGSRKQEAGLGSHCRLIACKACLSLTHFLDFTSKRVHHLPKSHWLGTKCSDTWLLSYFSHSYHNKNPCLMIWQGRSIDILASKFTA